MVTDETVVTNLTVVIVATNGAVVTDVTVVTGPMGQ